MSTPQKAGGRSNGYFSKVRLARETLKERSVEILEAMLALAAEARDAGDREVAADILWKLLDHMPKDEGVGVLDSPASKPPTGSSGPTQPAIQIGIALTGQQQPQLSPSVIDVSPLEVQDEKSEPIRKAIS